MSVQNVRNSENDQTQPSEGALRRTIPFNAVNKLCEQASFLSNIT